MGSRTGNGGHLDLIRLAEVSRRPPLFAPHEAPFWDDPYIAQQMLAAHLDPDRKEASRQPQIIDQEVRWIMAQLGLQPGQRVLDLGCGSGLYCARLATLGLLLTGLDLSSSSIDYARRYASEHRLAIEYVCQNYCSLDRIEAFAAAILIYLDFSVLADGERDAVLTRVHRALEPGGAFVFDVTTPAGQLYHDGAQRWAVRSSGFWRPAPHLELTQEYAYPDQGVDLQQTVIVDETGEATVYRIWNQTYTVESITALLEQHSFQVAGLWSDLRGTRYLPESKTLGVLARKWT